jgi:TetR/AcrR family transcriptional regulator
MPAVPSRAARPRGRPPKGTEFAPVDTMMRAAAEAFAVQGYDGVSLRTVNDQLGVSRNLLYQRFGSKENLWRAVVDWAFRPFLAHLDSVDDDSADPMERLRSFIYGFIEYSATRPYLAGIATQEGAAATDRLDYLYDNYVNPVRSRFQPIFEQLQRTGKMRPVPLDTLYFLITSGGTAPFGQVGFTSRMGIKFDPDDPAQVRAYAEQLAEVLINGISTGP